MFNFNLMDINKVLDNKRLIKAVLGVRKESFEKLLVTFTQILKEEVKNNKRRKRAYGGGSNGNKTIKRGKPIHIQSTVYIGVARIGEGNGDFSSIIHAEKIKNFNALKSGCSRIG